MRIARIGADTEVRPYAIHICVMRIVHVRADTEVRPYEDDDAVQVIGHDDERVNVHANVK